LFSTFFFQTKVGLTEFFNLSKINITELEYKRKLDYNMMKKENGSVSIVLSLLLLLDFLYLSEDIRIMSTLKKHN
jgi:hypothetical protein